MEAFDIFLVSTSPSGYRPYLDPDPTAFELPPIWTPTSRPSLPELPSQNLC